MGARPGSAFALAAALAALPSLAPGAPLAPQQLCTVSATGLRFGAYNGHQASDLMSAGNITFTCTRSQPISIKIETGSPIVAGYRAMRSGAHQLAYQVYLDAAGTQIWGDGANGSKFYTNASPPTGSAVVVPFFGRIPAGQSGLVAGAYGDTLMVRIDF